MDKPKVKLAMGKVRLGWLSILMLISILAPASGDEIRASLLTIKQISAQDFDITFNVPARGVNQRLALNVVFDSSVQVLGQVRGDYIDGAYASHWQIRHPNQLKGSRVRIEGLVETPTEVLVRIEFLDRDREIHRLTPAVPELVLAQQSSWLDVAQSYLVLGIEHILEGADHLLFVLALLLLISNTITLIATITSFTLAHSITLMLASVQILRLPVPPVEACIALSIVFVCREILAVQQGKTSLSKQRPWLVAFCFGLLHGLGFAAVLGEIGLPQEGLFTALILFNVGVEIGQLLFIAVVLAVYYLARKVLNPASVWLVRIPVYVIGSVSSYWLIERVVGFWTA